MDREIVFTFNGYKTYLNAICGEKGTRKGMRSALARASGCNTAYVSQVLNGDRHFSLEQAYRISDFLHHSIDESRFFLLLVQRDRAGIRDLRRHFEVQLKELLEARRNIQRQLGHPHQLNEAEQSRYYSSWIYAAVHVAMSVPELRNREQLARRLGVPVSRISEILNFLFQMGILIEDENGISAGSTHIHLGADSTHIARHHANWRVQALKAIDRLDQNDLHYSACVSVSKVDFDRIKDSLIETIRQLSSDISQSQEEDVCVINLDWFRL